MLIAVVVVFLLCWGPKVIFDVIIKLSPEVLFSIASFRAKVTLKNRKILIHHPSLEIFKEFIYLIYYHNFISCKIRYMKKNSWSSSLCEEI